jgi:hypothetical protein
MGGKPFQKRKPGHAIHFPDSECIVNLLINAPVELTALC